jgi:hypothetical protein
LQTSPRKGSVEVRLSRRAVLIVVLLLVACGSAADKPAPVSVPSPTPSTGSGDYLNIVKPSEVTDQNSAALAAATFVENELITMGVMPKYEELRWNLTTYRDRPVVKLLSDLKRVDSAIWNPLGQFASKYDDELAKEGIAYLGYHNDTWSPPYLVASLADARAKWRQTITNHEFEKALIVVNPAQERPEEPKPNEGTGGNDGG